MIFDRKTTRLQYVRVLKTYTTQVLTTDYNWAQSQEDPENEIHDLMILKFKTRLGGSEALRIIPLYFSLKESGRKWESNPEIGQKWSNSRINPGPSCFQLRALPTEPHMPKRKCGDADGEGGWVELAQARQSVGRGWLARHSTINEMGPPHRLDV